MGRLRLPWHRLWLAAALVAVAACGGDPSSPEQRVRALVAAMEEAVEAGSIKRAAELVDGAYRDEWHADKRAALGTLFAYLQRHRGIHLFTLVKDVTLADEGSRAHAVVIVAMTGVPVESVESLITVQADLYRFEIDLTTSDDAWRVVGARWRRVDLGAL